MLLPEPLQGPTFGFLASLDERLPGRVTGLYLVGSLALGDFSSRVSNVDAVVVSDQPWSAEDLAVAVPAHQGWKWRRPPVVAYVVASDLRRDPRSLDRPCFEGSRPVPSARLVNPLTWQLLDRGALDLRGPDHVGVWSDPAALRRWAAGQLRDVWAARLPHLDSTRSLWMRREVSGSVLEVARLSVLATSGSLVSKTEAARQLQAEVLGRFRRILTDAVGYRYGGRTSMYWGPVERRQHARELLHGLVATSAEGLVRLS